MARLPPRLKCMTLETASLFIGVLNIIAAISAMICICACIITQNPRLGPWLLPWPNTTETKILLEDENHMKYFNYPALIVFIFFKLALPLVMILVLMVIGFSSALIRGVLKRNPSYVRAFWIQAAVVLPVNLILSILYIGVLYLKDHNLNRPIHITMAVTNIAYAVELFVAYKTYKKMKDANILPLIHEKEPETKLKSIYTIDFSKKNWYVIE